VAQAGLELKDEDLDFELAWTRQRDVWQLTLQGDAAASRVPSPNRHSTKCHFCILGMKQIHGQG
jgi:hypothetical protein